MRRRNWLFAALLALPLAAAGWTYGQGLVRTDQPQDSARYVCALTGEELPCSRCCPLGERR